MTNLGREPLQIVEIVNPSNPMYCQIYGNNEEAMTEIYKRNRVDIDLLRKYLSPDFDFGILIWKHRAESDFQNVTSSRGPSWYCNVWNAKNAGNEALASINSNGYKAGSFFGRSLLAHRVIWAMYRDKWPGTHLDHIDGNRSNNKIENLREVTQAQNALNAKASGSSSKYKGVSFCNRSQRWVVYCQVNKKSKFGGYFDNEIDAAIAYDSLAKEMHGKFCRLNFPDEVLK